METIIKTGFVPCYHQLKEILSRAISKGEFEPGQPLPPERELCRDYQVSRTTVRKALDILMHEGYIYREQGRGTFAGKLPLEQPAQIISFTEEMKRRGLKPSTEVLKTEICSHIEKIAKALAVNINEEVIMVKRLRLANKEPLALETSYLPHKLYPGLLSQNLSGSLTKLTEKKYHLRFKYASQVVKAGLVYGKEAKILGLKRNSPVLSIQRTAFLVDNRPSEYLEALYRADRYELTMELKGR